MAVQSEDDLDRLSVPAGDVEPVGAPALVGAGRFDLAGVGSVDPPSHLARQHQVVDPHHPPNPLAVVGPLSALEPGPVDQPPDAPIPVAGPLLGHREDLAAGLLCPRRGDRSPPTRPSPQIRRAPSHLERPANGRHRTTRHRPDPLNKCGLFFTRSRAASRISMVIACLPTRRCSCLTCCSSSRTDWPAPRPRLRRPPSSHHGPPGRSSCEERKAGSPAPEKARPESSLQNESGPRPDA